MLRIAIAFSFLVGCGARSASSLPAASRSPVDFSLATRAADNGWRSQIIYLVMPDRFRNGDTTNDNAGSPNCFDPSNPQQYHGGDLAGLTQNLSYIQSFGATAIWVTPLYRQIGLQANGHCGYHGYWSDPDNPDDGAIEPKLGDAAALSALLNAVHGAGMRFILDMVVNHTGDTAQLPKQEPTWFHDPSTCNSIITCPLNNHPDFAQENPVVATYLSNAAAAWVSTYGIDGIRMDTAKYVAPSYFQNSFFPAVFSANAKLFSVAEIFDTGSTSVFTPYLSAGFDSAFHFELQAALVSSIGQGGTIDNVADAIADGVNVLGLDGALDLVLMMDNHDVPRFANAPGLSVPEDEIRRRELLALDLVFTLPGIPQLYSGDEIGMYGAADPDNRRDLPPWASDATARQAAHPGEAVAGSDVIFARVAALAALRTQTQAFIDGAYRELWRQNGSHNPNVFAFARGTGAAARIVVVSNGASASGTVSMSMPADIAANGATLVDDLGDGAPSPLTIVNGKLPIDMPAKSAGIYRILAP